MNLNIKCNNELITHILDENYKEIRIEKSNSFNLDLNNECFLYFDILDKKSEIIRISNLLTSLEVNYYDDKEKLEVNIDSDNYGEVKVVKLKDEKNLLFREDKEKVINILLPFNYDKNKKYGLIIMFDSQNIYDLNKVGKYTSLNDPYGGWQVDSTLSIVKEKYHKEYIVVGIEDADKYRATELTPSSKIYEFKDILKDLGEESLSRVDDTEILYKLLTARGSYDIFCPICADIPLELFDYGEDTKKKHSRQIILLENENPDTNQEVPYVITIACSYCCQRLRNTLIKSEFDGKNLILTTQISHGMHEKTKSKQVIEMSPANIQLMKMFKI